MKSILTYLKPPIEVGSIYRPIKDEWLITRVQNINYDDKGEFIACSCDLECIKVFTGSTTYVGKKVDNYKIGRSNLRYVIGS